MNRHEAREISKLAVAHKLGMADMVARSLSALIRASMTRRSRNALMAQAVAFGLTSEPEFII